MEGVGSEVSLKIRSAIKAKLVELGTYVDEELPDYIMVLVANKKTKDQMDDDLSLFLGHNTERFTSWLHHVIQKLNAAALLQVTTPQPDETKKKETTTEEENKKLKEEENRKLKEEEKRREKEEAKKREKAEENKKVKDEEKKKNKEKDKIEKKKKLDRKEKNVKVDTVEEENVEKGKKSKERDREGKEKIKSPVEEENGSSVVVEGVDDVQAITGSVGTKKIKPLVRGKVSSADIFIAEAADGKEEEEVVVEDMLELRAEVDELGLELEEEPVPKKAKAEQRKKIVAPKTISKEDVEMESRLESKVEIKVKKSKHGSPTSRVSAREGLGRVLSPKSDQPKEKPSILDRLGTTHSSSRRIINLREESSFPPRSDSSSNGSNSGMARAVSSAISSAQRSVCVLPSSSSSGKKLEARVRPLMSKHIESSRDEHSQEGSSCSNVGRVVSAVGAVLKRPHKEIDSDDEEYDPKKPMLSSMASKVEVIPRPRRTGAMQANTALILRAMADAHKSVNKPSRRHGEKGESPKKKQKGELYTRSYREREQARQKELPEKDEIKLRKIAITVPNATRKESEKQQQEESIIMSEIGSIVTKPIEKRKLERPIPMEEDEYEIIGTDGYDVEEMEEIEEGDLDESMNEQPLQLTHHKVPLLSGNKTKFIVTLEGLDAESYQVRNERPDIRSRLGARPVHNNDGLEEVEEYIEEVEEWEEIDAAVSETNQEMTQVGELSETGKPKVKSAITALPATETGIKKPEIERCKFWPACKTGETCPYHHPSVPCKLFPNCTYNDKCRYVHPKCMYDVLCTRIGCPYMHTARNPLLIAAGTKHKLVVPSRPAKIKCRFFPKCTNMSCPFLHPKACFYGVSCIQSNCLFSHPEIPTGAKLKWIAPKTTILKVSVAATENKAKEVLSTE